MALDKTLTQNITLKANGDQLAKSLDGFLLKIQEVIGKLSKMDSSMMRSGDDAERKYRSVAQQLQRLIGEASTLNNLVNGQRNNRRDSLFSVLDEQSLGKKAISASKLRQELDKTTRASDALDLRLAQIGKRAGDLASVGRVLGKTDLNKAFQTKDAVAQVRALEREMAKLDARARLSGGYSTDSQALRDKLGGRYTGLLSQIQNPNRSTWTAAIAGVSEYVEKLRLVSQAEARAGQSATKAAVERRQSILKNINQTEEMLRASLQRQSSQYKFTPDQARSADLLVNARNIDLNMAKLGALQRMMSRALNPENPRAPAVLERLQRSWEGVSRQTAEALALRKAYDQLPESRAKAVNQYLFSGNGLQFGARIAGAMTLAAVAGAAIGAVQQGIQQVVQFEDELAKLQAIAGATDQQMMKLGASIREVASNSRYSTVEITQAATMIAQAGFSAEETGQVLKSALTLAAGSGSSPTEAVDTLTSSLGAFQLQASESTRVVDILMQGLNRSKLAINQMQAAIQYAGATAKENGVRFEELVAIAASLANAGIRSGSTIGTGLRQLLVDLKTPTEKFENELKSLGLTLADVDVKSKGVAEVVRTLTEAGFSAEAAYESFEVRAASAFLAFRNQIGNYDELALSLAQTGAAAEANERAMNSFSARLQELKNNLLELVSSGTEPLVNAFSIVFVALSEVVGVLNDLNKATDGALLKISLFVGAFAINPVLGWIVGISTLVGLFKNASESAEDLATKTAEAQAELDKQEQTLLTLDQAIGDVIAREETLRESKPALATETLNLTSKFKELSTELVKVSGDYDGLLAAMLRYKGAALEEQSLRATRLANAKSREREPLLEQFKQSTFAFDKMNKGYRKNQPGSILDAASRAGTKRVVFSDIGSVQEVSNTLLSEIVGLENIKDPNGYHKYTLKKLKDRLDLLNRIVALNGEIDQATKRAEVAAARRSPGGQMRDQWIGETTSGVTRGLNQNKDKPGSGNALLNTTLKSAQTRIDTMKQELARLNPQSGRAMSLDSQIAELKAQVAKVQRARDQAAREAEKVPALKDQPGARLTSAQVVNELRSKIGRPIAVTDTTRSASAQVGHDRRAGIKRDPYKAPHVTGNALDMKPVPGMDPMEVVAIIEDMGLEVTGAPVKRAGTRYIEPNHGTGRHWHFEWKPKATRFEQAQASSAEKAARELQQLLEYQAGSEVKTVESRIKTLINEAKGGSIALGDLNGQFASAGAGYRTKRLAEFDTKNPTSGLGAAALQQRALARKALEDEITQKLAEYHANLWRAIQDMAEKDLDAALKATDLAFDRDSAAIEQRYQEVESRGRTLTNGINRSRFGDGAAYGQQRREFGAGIQRDQSLDRALMSRQMGQEFALDGYRAKMAGADPGSENYIEAQQKIADVEADIVAIQQQRLDLQRSLNERTQEYANIPLAERLRDSVAAWAENSGAMDTWGKTLENSIGPALDMFTDQLVTMFTAVADGTKTMKQALGDFLQAFVRFVFQIIAKALALMAVKAILSAFGLNLQNTGGGVIIGKKSFDGGPVEAYGNAFSGGPVNRLYGGGRIATGSPMRDSTMYQLAQGEYVVRNKSVRDLGLPFMETLNKYGRAGLNKMAGANSAFANIQMPRQETNVYVVADKGDAPMGPNDVLVTIQRDLMQGGATKQLVRQIAQGG